MLAEILIIMGFIVVGLMSLLTLLLYLVKEANEERQKQKRK